MSRRLEIILFLIAFILLTAVVCNYVWADESSSSINPDQELTSPLDIPLYPHILETKQVDTHGIKGTITQYTTRDLMRDVVAFYTKALERDDYRIIGNGWIEFVFDGEELPYNYESPNYSEPEGKGTTHTKSYPVTWQSLVIRIDHKTGNTDILVNDLDRESAIAFWKEQRQREADMIKAGPRQIFLPPAANNK